MVDIGQILYRKERIRSSCFPVSYIWVNCVVTSRWTVVLSCGFCDFLMDEDGPFSYNGWMGSWTNFGLIRYGRGWTVWL